ncbi:hypothetical protein K439DRAFT_1639593 [Ramaria rubella]|nr:hypothetical protein K439DRAFT_1639593 [Ramaria rubella]
MLSQTRVITVRRKPVVSTVAVMSHCYASVRCLELCALCARMCGSPRLWHTDLKRQLRTAFSGDEALSVNKQIRRGEKNITKLKKKMLPVAPFQDR